MATKTPNLDLTRPEHSDQYNIADFNINFDKIDLFSTTVEPKIEHKSAFNKNFGSSENDIKADGIKSLGTKDEIARVDHIHPTDTTRASLSVATKDANGLMSAADKTKLDSANVINTIGSLVIRDGNGRAKISSPVDATDIANKGTVDALSDEIDIRILREKIAEVDLATTVNLANLYGVALVIDGIVATTGKKILVKDQENKKNNGVWTAESGAWTRETSEHQNGYSVFVKSGTNNKSTWWTITTRGAITVGSSEITFKQDFRGGGSDGKITGTGANVYANNPVLKNPIVGTIPITYPLKEGENPTIVSDVAASTRFVRDFVFPVGKVVVQHYNERKPVELYGGTWTEMYTGESVFFRTYKDGVSGDFNGGVQSDAMREIEGNLYNIAGVHNRFSTADKAFTVERTGASDYDYNPYGNRYTVKFKASNVVPTANEFRPKNVAIRVWRRTQ